eukprot:SM000063S20052  [mRNA]  locus=s63:487201:491105:+ [translate_table: standard]
MAAPELLVLYGSQTGNAMEIAKRIDAEASAAGVRSRVAALNDCPLASLASGPPAAAVFVVSSTGDGDPPESCDRFVGALRRRSLPLGFLAGLQYTVLGLGDSNYTTYMGVPRVFTSRLPELGARCFYPCGEADDVEGLEECVDAWVAGLWAPLHHTLGAAAGGGGGGVAIGTAVENGHAPQAKQDSSLEELVGVPALPPCRVRIVWLVEDDTAAELAAGGGGSSAGASLMSMDRLTTAESLGRLSGGGPEMVPRKVRGLGGALSSVDSGTAIAAMLGSGDRLTTGEGDDGPDGGGPGGGIGPLGPALAYSAAAPLQARVAVARRLTAPWSDRAVVHLGIDVTSTGLSFRPGDSLGILPRNDPQLVAALLDRLGAPGDRLFRVEAERGNGGEAALGHLHCPCTLGEALSSRVDVTAAPKKGLLRVLAEYCADDVERRRLLFLCSRGGRDAYKAEMMEARPSLLDLLQAAPSCRPDLGHLLESLPQLVARFYSITNSRAVDSHLIEIAFRCELQLPQPKCILVGPVTSIRLTLEPLPTSVVRMETAPGRIFRGVCTNWLERELALGASGERARGMPALKIPVFVRGGGSFSPPQNLESPLVMVGPGTGVAPFRGFLQERRRALATDGSSLQAAPCSGQDERDGASAVPDEVGGRVAHSAIAGTVGESWLFFGCRRQEEDFLYRDELEGFVADGTLSRLVVAYSRTTDKKVYVQHRMLELGASLCKLLLNPLTFIFICGDGADMAKGVHAALVSVLASHGKMKEPMAIAHLAAMMKEHRYVRDIWS